MSDITILDGGMGQELIHRYGQPPTPLWSTHVMMQEPDLVGDIHDDYFAAGAHVATTNTYAIHHDRLLRQDPELDKQFSELHVKACEIACKSRDKNGSGMVAGSLGPLGFSYRPDLSFPPEEARKMFAEIARLHEPYVDVHLIETVSKIEHAHGCLLGTAGSSKPTWLGVTVSDEDGTILRSGEPLSDVKALFGEYDVSKLLINCATPEAVDQAMDIIADIEIPFGSYANGFTFITSDFTKKETVDQLEARTDLSPEKYADFCSKWVDQGASIVGGCCEVGPAHIAELSRRFG
ncbi:MAG: homocysteine S-methyltransferase family protein [Rhizobiaceae bacterium]|nr:homocysteine S-methyltransferase family protein [Rhizobiaceae bacterium]